MLIDKGTLPLIKKVVLTNGKIELPAEGNSMFPFIKRGDFCSFNKCDPCKVKKGNIILFITKNNQLVAHRLTKVNQINNQTYYFFKGDTNLGHDEPISEEQFIGKLTMIKRNNRNIKVDGLLQNFWGMLIITIPILSQILRNYLNRKNGLQI